MIDDKHVISSLVQDERDLERLTRFLAQVQARDSDHCHWHRGDLIWSRYQNLTFDPQQHVCYWQDAQGELLAFAWFAPYGTTIQVAPEAKEETWLYNSILAWAEEHWQSAFAHEAERRNLWVHAFADNATFREALLEHGFQQGEDCQLLVSQSLSADLSKPSIPAGWTIRPLSGEHEFIRRLEIEYACSQVAQSLEAYRQMRNAAGYLADLDLAVFDAENVMVGYVTLWFDPTAQSGCIEPLNIHPSAHRRGAGRMLLQEGLYRLQEYGATSVRVCPSAESEQAKSFYTAMGFIHRNADWYWFKPMREQSPDVVS